MAEVAKQNKYLESFNMSEDEAITVYTLSIFDLGLFGGKRFTRSDIGTLPDYTKERDKSLQIDLGYDIEKSWTQSIRISRRSSKCNTRSNPR